MQIKNLIIAISIGFLVGLLEVGQMFFIWGISEPGWNNIAFNILFWICTSIIISLTYIHPNRIMNGMAVALLLFIPYISLLLEQILQMIVTIILNLVYGASIGYLTNRLGSNKAV